MGIALARVEEEKADLFRMPGKAEKKV